MRPFNGKGEDEREPVPECAAGLGAGIVDLLYTQVFTPGELATEQEVCRAFTELLLAHWKLCCVIIYLQDEGGGFHESAMHAREEMDTGALREAAGWMTRKVERDGRELQVRLDGDGQSIATEEDMVASVEARGLFTTAAVRAGVALPIHTRGAHVATLVVLTAYPELLREALPDVRFVAAPLVISLGVARRSEALREQRAQIERLVEELRQRGAALEEANRELRDVARYRSMLLARMSHELRTPLTSILGFAEILLEQEDLTDTQQLFCEKIQKSGRQLEAVVKQLVDLSRLEAGRTELFLHEFSVRETLRESCAAVARLAEQRCVSLDCTTAPECPMIVSDEGKLRQVFYNLLSNAVERSPVGGTVRLEATVPAPARIRLEITDDGESLTDPAHFFVPDCDEHQASGCESANELWLAITHRLIKLLGGTIEFATESARGLTVCLEFPTRPPDS